MTGRVPQVRRATEADGVALAAIYRPYVEETTISFEETPPDGAEMGRRVVAGGDHYPWLVAERDGAPVGYAAASPHRRRAAYRWCVEVGIYVRQDARRTGLGRALYTGLLGVLTRQGFVSAYAGITQPNPESAAFHRAQGFTEVGTYRAAGYKLGRWCDVLWMQRQLQPLDRTPTEVRAALPEWSLRSEG